MSDQLLTSTDDEYKRFDFLLDVPGLICAFYYDYVDQKWQSEKDIQAYKQEGIDISKLSYTKNRAGEKIIDVTNNYGRSVFCIGIQFIAASRMYFGKYIFKLIPIEKIISFSNRIFFNQKNEKIFEILLFSIFEDDLNTIRTQQKMFLEQTNLYERLESLNEKHFGIKSALADIGIY